MVRLVSAADLSLLFDSIHYTPRPRALLSSPPTPIHPTPAPEHTHTYLPPPSPPSFPGPEPPPPPHSVASDCPSITVTRHRHLPSSPRPITARDPRTLTHAHTQNLATARGPTPRTTIYLLHPRIFISILYLLVIRSPPIPLPRPPSSPLPFLPPHLSNASRHIDIYIYTHDHDHDYDLKLEAPGSPPPGDDPWLPRRSEMQDAKRNAKRKAKCEDRAGCQ
ncbi:hypothetical protein D9615_010486 [Tricholomella constricta]|uniref:Uncharacterized protein n=1 Tax=Tricholomella constricta TaxID=117010 RepID=A0A8H5GMZ0_9AGAR|nr:hypothetical protein D9615_010486 [Tricholomella constricta]